MSHYYGKCFGDSISIHSREKSGTYNYIFKANKIILKIFITQISEVQTFYNVQVVELIYFYTSICASRQ